MKRYINLSTHSNASVGETVVTPEEIVEFAIKDGAKAVALTDLNSVHGLTAFSEAVKKHKNVGIKPIYGVQIFGVNADKVSVPRKITLLARNRNGLKNMYKILSLGYMKVLSDEKWPCVSYDDVRSNREGVFVGLECTESDISRVWADDERGYEGEKLKELIDTEYAIADYVEIKPWYRYAGMPDRSVKEGEGKETAVKQLLNTIAKCLERVHKWAVAGDGSNYITERDALCCNILHDDLPDTRRHLAPFLTTEEMLCEYGMADDGLPENSAMIQKLVLDNPAAIADRIDRFSIEEAEEYPAIRIANAEEILKESCAKALHEKYGEVVPRFISERYESELENILSNDYASYYVLASMLAEKSRERGYLHTLRGCAAGSFVVYLMGISESNPLPPHYYCPNCKRVELVDDVAYPSGFDLTGGAMERKNCPACGERLVGDGHNIPVEFFAGYDGDKVPDFDFNFASEIQADMVAYLQQIFGEDKVFGVGTKGVLFYRGSERLVTDYADKHHVPISPDEKHRMAERLSAVFRANGRHPGGILIVPEGKEIFDFSPIGYCEPFELRENRRPVTLIKWDELPLEKWDILGYRIPSKIKLMQEMTGIRAETIRLEEIDYNVPYLSDSFKRIPFIGESIRKIADAMPITGFSDLIRVLGLAHGSGAYEGNGESLLEKGCDPKALIAHREDVMLTLLRHGLDRKTAFQLAEMVCKGKAKECLDDAQETCLREHNIPKWYIESMKTIRYLFPKAHEVEYAMNHLRMIWYRIYYPAAFYAAVLTVDFDNYFDCFVEGKALDWERLCREWEQGDYPIFDYRNGEMLTREQRNTLELARECYENGIRLLLPDVYMSRPDRFVPEGNAIRIPFISPGSIDEKGVHR